MLASHGKRGVTNGEDVSVSFLFVSLLLSVAFGLVFPRRAVDATFGGVVKL